MEESQKSELFFSLMRIVCAQTLRAAGIDKTKRSLLDSLTDVVIRYIALLSELTMEKAELCRRRQCEVTDFRCALEDLQMLDGSKEDVVEMIEWFKGPQVQELRRVSGFDNDLDERGKPRDWLTSLLNKQVRVSGPERFHDTVFAPYIQNMEPRKP
ncbi:transcription factor TFIID complex subunit Taf3 [Schizosaccharomyces japonicus yFS275]|uniref:Transcription factor TFIID complex subunit Taf3 n=1 Tax=Schizosaccharomyces japonicus (strain yFS275 / FY16936) TaxID=402676 RepID=B6K898_SCHJY|nr:transcription factor TFIID complex subunit Taf3 [Schizosaccharomyces japonicus yFS275]EEB09752.1 transcription factor TFIID complex subunit Taf3 [Schizosaccharomyces japonicus yFS275]